MIFHDQISFDWSFPLFYNIVKLYFPRMEEFLLYENFKTLIFGHDFWVNFGACKEMDFLIILIFGEKTVCTLH